MFITSEGLMSGKIKGKAQGHACGCDHDLAETHASTNAGHHHDDDHNHSHEEIKHLSDIFKQNLAVIIGVVLFAIGLVLDQFELNLLGIYQREWIYGVSYLIVSSSVFKQAWFAIRSGVYFSEFTLMGIATLGAMAIGEYPEGVAVMLFYSVGEIFQALAVSKARANIQALLDLRPHSASVLRDGNYVEIKTEDIEIDEVLQIRQGESVALDGLLQSDKAQINTAALTGESLPRDFKKGERLLAGMINQGAVIQLKVDTLYEHSALSKILDMVQNASARKAKTELFIRKFAKIYTPIVFFLAVAITLIPYFIFIDYVFADWLYRGLVFLVISCPCALVISIPLGYFGGIGAASKNGILFKGSNFIDALTKVTHVVMDKTGTLTTGLFEVQNVKPYGVAEEELLKILGAVESKSTHPIAEAISKYAATKVTFEDLNDVVELSGYGLKAFINNKTVLVGNLKLLEKHKISYPVLDPMNGSVVVVAFDNHFIGYVSVADTLKKDAKRTVESLNKKNIETVMLSGDKNSVTQAVAQTLGIKYAYGDLLPEDKMKKVEEIKSNKKHVVAFVGDGINDAPVLALSDVGIAMGAMGSDAAIESANVVLQDDNPLNIIKSINIAKTTRQVVIQNILLAFSIKAVVLILGAGGLASMWEAVFADVGVALLAILNAIRIQRYKF